MPRQSYFQRLSRGLLRGGQTRQQARGHRDTPEHPVRALQHPERYAAYIQRNFDRLDVLQLTPEGQRALARANDERRRAGKPPIVIGPPPDPGPGVRQFTFDTFGDAERWTAGPPPTYASIYIWRGGITGEKRSAVRQRRRAA